MKPELIFYHGGKLLEGPHWDNKNNLLYFVSIRNNMIFSLNPDTKAVKVYQTDGAVGLAVIDGRGDIIEAEKSGIYRINASTGEKTFIAHPIDDEKMRYNDGKLDDKGRLLVGTMGDLERAPGEGKLYSVEGTSSRVLIEGTTISNGLGFSSDNKTMYFIDTPTHKVMAYDYNLSTGDAANEREVIEITGGGAPDGMCVDIDDMIWVAEWGGGRVCKWNPTSGQKLCEIKLPCVNVSSCCIGGALYDTLFITTARCDGRDEAMAGGLFRVKIR